MEAAPSLVTTVSGVQEAADSAAAAGRMGLDTEFLREKTYRARLCLVQVATPDAVFVIDPLVCDVSPLAQLVASPGVEVVVHAGSQDFEIFYESFGVVPVRVFDVQIAAGFAGLGASLPYGRLVGMTLQTALEKTESYTDWCRRPLTDAQIRYAADDVTFLLPLADRLKARLSELGRMTWVEEEMKPLEDKEQYQAKPDDAWRRVSGRGALSPNQTGVLAELARWREETAARRDVPRGWVIKDVTLIELARRMPSTVEELETVRGLPYKEAHRSARHLLDAIRRGARAPSIRMPPAPSRRALARAKSVSGLADALIRARCERAGLAPELVATRAELEALVIAAATGSVSESRHRLLEGWRREVAGEAVLGLLEGRIALRAMSEPPYIEELSL